MGEKGWNLSDKELFAKHKRNTFCEMKIGLTRTVS